MRRGAGVLLVAALVAGLAACSGAASAGSTEVAGIPVLEGSTWGPGTRLGAGFTVARGSVLVGATFPANDRPVPDSGFTALLLITGPFSEVFDAYRRQAADIGVDVRPGNAELRAFCWRDEVVKADTCAGSGNITSEVVGPTVSLTAYRGPAVGHRAPLSHLVLTYDDAGPGEPAAPIRLRRREPSGADPPLPTRWPPLPPAGQVYEAPLAQVPLRVPEGAQLVSHPTESTCGGSIAVLRTDRDPRAVVDDLIQRGAHVSSRDRFRDGDTVDEDVQWTWDGTYRAQSTSRPGQPAYVLVTHCEER
jgi:hypothetical protein